MVRKALLVFGLCALSSFPAQAQDEDKVELFGGYSYMRFRSTNLNGWEAAGQYRFLDWLAEWLMLPGTTGPSAGSAGSAHRRIRFSSDRKSHALAACRHSVTCCWAERITAQGVSEVHPSQWRSGAASMRNCPTGCIGA